MRFFATRMIFSTPEALPAIFVPVRTGTSCTTSDIAHEGQKHFFSTAAFMFSFRNRGAASFFPIFRTSFSIRNGNSQIQISFTALQFASRCLLNTFTFLNADIFRCGPEQLKTGMAAETNPQMHCTVFFKINPGSRQDQMTRAGKFSQKISIEPRRFCRP
jgi:hypothetical protein